MNDADILQCSELILQSFSIRRDLIQEGKYTPSFELDKHADSKPGEGIWKWWSQSTPDDEKKSSVDQINPLITKGIFEFTGQFIRI